MVKKHIRMSIGALLIAVLAVSVSISSQSFAQSAETNKSTNVLKVSPVRTDIEVKPGESRKVPVTITNLTKSAITVSPIENDFIAGDENGTPALILDKDKYAPTHSLKRFMTPLADVSIPAGQPKTIDVVISVPKDAKAGGYFGAVRFAPVSVDGGSQVNLSASAASLILLTVPGNMIEKLDLTKFDIQQDGKAGSFFQSSNDLQAAVRFENKGSAQVGPFGKVTVKQGDSIVYEGDFNIKTPSDVILPDSARAWDIPLKKIGSFGNYTVTATFTYGQKNQTIEVTKSFWVVPQVVIIVTAVSLLLLVSLIVAIFFAVRGRRRRTHANFKR